MIFLWSETELTNEPMLLKSFSFRSRNEGAGVGFLCQTMTLPYRFCRIRSQSGALTFFGGAAGSAAVCGCGGCMAGSIPQSIGKKDCGAALPSFFASIVPYLLGQKTS